MAAPSHGPVSLMQHLAPQPAGQRQQQPQQPHLQPPLPAVPQMQPQPHQRQHRKSHPPVQVAAQAQAAVAAAPAGGSPASSAAAGQALLTASWCLAPCVTVPALGDHATQDVMYDPWAYSARIYHQGPSRLHPWDPQPPPPQRADLGDSVGHPPAPAPQFLTASLLSTAAAAHEGRAGAAAPADLGRPRGPCRGVGGAGPFAAGVHVDAEDEPSRPPARPTEGCLPPEWEAHLPCGLLPSQVSDLLCREITPEDYELLLRLDEALPRCTTTLARVNNVLAPHTAGFLGESCAVCLGAFGPGDAVVSLPCRHLYHRACITKWLLESRNSCPLCGVEASPS